jgi:uncharacterized membrane protein YdjX (TVP38/TMEM64 family)
MKQYWTIVGLLLLFFLTAFVIVEQLQLPLLVNPQDYFATANFKVASLSVGLLIGDIILPIPSSFVMVANGALFGISGGTVLSVLGSLGAAAIGFGIGRQGGPLLNRFVPLSDRQNADRLLSKWGTLAIILTRPLPLLAETTVIMAGTSSMAWQNLFLGTFLGTLPTALLYAVTGALAASFESTTLAFGLVIAIAGFFWLISSRWHQIK